MNLSSNELKKVSRYFKYCPRCGKNQVKKNINTVTCHNCGLHFYLSPTPTTGAVLINERKEILLVKRAVDPGKGLWDIPGGFVDLNETLEDSLNRELKEELGVGPRDLKYLTSKVDMYKYKDVYQQTLGVIFEGKISSNEKMKATDDISGYKFFSKKDFPIDKMSFKSLEEFFRAYLAKGR